jgi:hypothetical protein
MIAPPKPPTVPDARHIVRYQVTGSYVVAWRWHPDRDCWTPSRIHLRDRLVERAEKGQR